MVFRRLHQGVGSDADALLRRCPPAVKAPSAAACLGQIAIAFSGIDNDGHGPRVAAVVQEGQRDGMLACFRGLCLGGFPWLRFRSWRRSRRSGACLTGPCAGGRVRLRFGRSFCRCLDRFLRCFRLGRGRFRRFCLRRAWVRRFCLGRSWFRRLCLCRLCLLRGLWGCSRCHRGFRLCCRRRQRLRGLRRCCRGFCCWLRGQRFGLHDKIRLRSVRQKAHPAAGKECQKKEEYPKTELAFHRYRLSAGQRPVTYLTRSRCFQFIRCRDSAFADSRKAWKAASSQGSRGCSR